MDKEKRRNELWRRYFELDKAFENAKLKRMIITILAFSIAIFIILCQIGGIPKGINILYLVVISVVLSGIHFFINVFIFGYLAHKGREERDILERIRKEISELDDPSKI